MCEEFLWSAFWLTPKQQPEVIRRVFQFYQTFTARILEESIGILVPRRGRQTFHISI
jgi:hypothetical protein